MNAIIIATIVIIVLVIILSIYQAQKSAVIKFNEEFIDGFWCADQIDCDLKGYKEAFLYIENTHTHNGIDIPSYILAIHGASGQSINCPFKLNLNMNMFSDTITGKCVAKDFNFDINVKCDIARGIMSWNMPSGEHIFTWIKNCDMSRKISSI
jgi:hypothetical protein